MHVVDLALGPLEPAALAGFDTLELQAGCAPPDALAAALTGLRGVRGLKELRLCSRVRALPPALGELRGLQRLAIVDEQLPGLPLAIGGLTRLRSLRIAAHHLASLPRTIAGLTRLRELHVESHHLCGLPDAVRALQELRSLTLVLVHEYVHDWARPAHFRPRFEQPLAELFTLLATLPALSSLALIERHDVTCDRPVFARLPVELAGLRALAALRVRLSNQRVALAPGLVMPSVRRIDGWFDTDGLQAAFPNAGIADDEP